MITADTITDEQIRELLQRALVAWSKNKLDWRACLEIALCDSAINDALDHGGRYARARCAEILNARAKESGNG